MIYPTLDEHANHYTTDEHANHYTTDEHVNHYTTDAQGLGASDKKKKKTNYIILQGGELTCSHFFKSSC